MRIFGPVLLYDMIRMARRSRFMLLRVFYALVLFSALFLVFASYFPDTWKNPFQSSGDPTLLSQFASSFFMTFMIIQWVLVLLLTPAYVAGAIAEEKHRRTLEYLLATDLSNREVILGKLVSRLGNLTLFILAGLPILSLTQLFGGVSPDLLWGGSLVTALTMLSLSGLSIWISVYARRPRDAILLAYLCVITYFAFYGVLATLRWTVFDRPLPGGWPTTPEDTAQVGFNWIYYVYNSGNVFQGLVDLYNAIAASATGSGYGDALRQLLIRYTVFHGSIFSFCTLLAILRVRRVFVKQTYNTNRAGPLTVRGGPSKHVSVGDFPMLWKEVISEGGFGIGWVGAVLTLIVGLIVLGFGVGIILYMPLSQARMDEDFLFLLGTLVVAMGVVFCLFVSSFWLPSSGRLVMRGLAVAIGVIALIVATQLFPMSTSGGGFGRGGVDMIMNIYVRTAGTIVASLIWLAITVRAAGTVGSERDRQTLESLLAAPLSNLEILLAKWVGSIAAARWLFAVLALIWMLGLITGALSFGGFLLSLCSLLIYAAFFCSLGMFCSVHCTTTLRAVLWAVGVSIFVGGAHLFCSASCMALFMFRAGPGDEWPMMFLVGETPVAVMFAAGLRGDEFDNWQSREMTTFAVFCFVGACTFGLAAIFLWAAAVERFKHTCGRVTGTPRLELPGRPAPGPVDSGVPGDKPESNAAPGDAAGP